MLVASCLALAIGVFGVAAQVTTEGGDVAIGALVSVAWLVAGLTLGFVAAATMAATARPPRTDPG